MMLARLFDVLPGEEHPLLLMFGLHFFLGVSFVTIEAAAYAIFIEQMGAGALPLTYLGVAAGLIPLAMIYLRLSSRLPFSQLMRGTLIFIISITTAFYIGILTAQTQGLAFLLVIWRYALVNLSNIVLWNVASTVFTIRQSKRLYNLISAGRWTATVIGGILIPVLVVLLGTSNLLLVSAASMTAALLFLMKVLAFKTAVPEPAKPAPKAPPASLLRDRYLLIIFANTAAAVMAVYVINNIFYTVGELNYPDRDRLAQVIGLVSAGGGFLGLIVNLFVAPRILNRFGLPAALLLTSVLLGAVLLAINFTAHLGVLFALAVLLRFILYGMTFALDVVGRRILYQPLPAELRNRALAFSEGIVEPIFGGISGLVLLAVNTGYLEQSRLGVVIMVAMFVTGLFCLRVYPRALVQTLVKRRFNEESVTLTAAGEKTLPEIKAALNQKSLPPAALMRLLRVCGRLNQPQLILPYLDHDDPEIRGVAAGALYTTGYQTTDTAAIYARICREAEQSAVFLAMRRGIEETLLGKALQDAVLSSRDRCLLLLGFIHDSQSIKRIRETLKYGSRVQRAYALEMIDTLLPKEVKVYLLPLLDDEKLQHLQVVFPQPASLSPRRLLDFPSQWIQMCARYTLGVDTMIATVERVLILKTVSIFAETADNVLAEIAPLLEEVALPAGKTLFEKGDLGNSMYIIINGRVRVHDGDHTLNFLENREVFGEMALLDPEPRLASITAVNDTTLFRLDQEPFYELMADRIEVVRGIMRVIIRNLRASVRDAGELSARLHQLSGK